MMSNVPNSLMLCWRKSEKTGGGIDFVFVLLKLLIMEYTLTFYLKWGGKKKPTKHLILLIICPLFIQIDPLCGRFLEEEAGELRADPGGAREDPEDGAAFRPHQSQAEGGGCHQRSGHHLLGRSLRVYRRLARAPAGAHQRGQVCPQHGLVCVSNSYVGNKAGVIIVSLFPFWIILKCSHI